MTNDIETIRACMAQTNPARLDYEQWLGFGMALKDAGGTVGEFDQWSAKDAARYKPREAERKWASFKNSNLGAGFGVGSCVKACRDNGGTVETRHQVEDGALEWDAVIGGGMAAQPKADCVVVRQEWTQDAPLPPEPAKWDGRDDFRRYLRAVFQSDDRVNIVVQVFTDTPKDGGAPVYKPKGFGMSDRTAGELIEALDKAPDLGAVIGDWNKDAGAWMRFNPVDGNGCQDSNITAFRFALVECDEMAIERQYAIYQKLELPIAALVHSGGKSLHAIVRIEADTFGEYQKRVDFLYDVCRRNGLVIDRKNRNPSRLSRVPGVTRGGRKQWLVATGVGKATWGEWADWIAAVNDDLPEVECLADVWNHMPSLAEPLIDGILRHGHKMLVAGPSKAGKSFLLLQLAIAIAEKRPWIGWKCEQGRVLYVNLELDKASAMNRLKDVYDRLAIPPANIANIDVWNLRGKSLPMDQLAPKLIRRAMKRRYSAVIIDPIYKVITGDENAADQMAKFCNMFDKICCELGSAVIYCHHHSKGDQGGKRAHDRASGSGVFARDPDALLDMIELAITDARRKQMANRWDCDAMAAALDAGKPGWREVCPEDDALVADKLAAWAEGNGAGDIVRSVRPDVHQAAEAASGWRVEGILREFPGFKPRRFFFRYPLHVDDQHGLLLDALAEGEEPHRKSPQEAGHAKAEKTEDSTLTAIDAVRDERGVVKFADLIQYLGVTKSSVSRRLKNAGFVVANGIVEEAKNED